MLTFARTGNEDVLLSGLGSDVLLDTEAVFVTCAAVSTVSTNSAVVVFPSSPGRTLIVQLMVPAPPGAGVVQLKAGPLFCDQLTKVLPEGTESVRVTLAASFGPALRTTMPKVVPPPDTATETSADGAVVVIAVVRLAVLLEVFGSVSSAARLALLGSVVCCETPVLTGKVNVNTGGGPPGKAGVRAVHAS